ncbi:MAG: hypothetical protein PSW75_08515 [bacterium]|nr:hypothetical protein [bacterium]MDI1337570.1 hypothetical protein [Lacunisphaera sp.]
MNQSRPKFWGLAALILLLLLLVLWRQCSPRSMDSQPNLLVNGDAEAGPVTIDGPKFVSPPGWVTKGPFSVIAYGTNGYPRLASPGPDNRGKNFFAGGPRNLASSATQVVDVSGYARAIDAQELAADLSSYLGGYDEQNDHAAVTAEFQDAATKLGGISLGPVLAVDRNKKAGLLLRSVRTPVPSGTRKIVVTMAMTRTDGEANDGYADNLVLRLVPRDLK